MSVRSGSLLGSSFPSNQGKQYKFPLGSKLCLEALFTAPPTKRELESLHRFPISLHCAQKLLPLLLTSLSLPASSGVRGRLYQRGGVRLVKKHLSCVVPSDKGTAYACGQRLVSHVVQRVIVFTQRHTASGRLC